MTRDQAVIAWEQQYRDHLESAIDKIHQGLAAVRNNEPAPVFSFEELRALRQFIITHDYE